jgi:glycosyltransferase involved in cell wall biosynthesis
VGRRVLFVLPSLDAGGAERAILRLLVDLPRERVEPHLALVARRGVLLPRVPPDVPVHDLGARRVRFSPPAVVRLTRRLQPQVLFSTLGYLNLALLASRPLLPGVGLVVREANTVSAELARLPQGRLWRLGYRLLYPRADAIVCPARAVLEDLATHLGTPRERLHHIPNPIDSEAICREADEASSPYASPGPHVLAVGRLVPQKGFRRLIEAFALVVRRVPEARLWILGEGPERSALEAQARALGILDHVELPGFVANPFVWMRRARLLVQSSLFEGLPNALLEALACGTPVVALDEPGGTREIVDEATGAVCVPTGAPRALADAIERALTQEKGNRSTLPDRYRPKRVITAYVRLFESLPV